MCVGGRVGGGEACCMLKIKIELYRIKSTSIIRYLKKYTGLTIQEFWNLIYCIRRKRITSIQVHNLYYIIYIHNKKGSNVTNHKYILLALLAMLVHQAVIQKSYITSDIWHHNVIVIAKLLRHHNNMHKIMRLLSLTWSYKCNNNREQFLFVCCF